MLEKKTKYKDFPANYLVSVLPLFVLLSTVVNRLVLVFGVLQLLLVIVIVTMP